MTTTDSPVDTDGSADVLGDAHALGDVMVDLRRTIHRHPELGLFNPVTQGVITAALDGVVDAIRLGTGVSSVVADIVGDAEGPTVLLRADTDALPMQEDNLDDFRSEVDGRAHLCGHDAHTAMLLGAARLLADRREVLRGTVRLAFQPGEEGGGGAAIMIDEGALTEGLRHPVSRAFAIHITPNGPVGLVASRPGPLLASTDEFRCVIRGRGAHASTPHFGVDPIPVACEVVTALQTFVGRRVNAFDPAVVTVGRITAGTTSNVIPATAEILGTIRTVSDSTREFVCSGVERVARGIAAAHDCDVDVEITTGYPVTANDARMVESVAAIADEVGGQHTYFELPSPVMGAEDFSYFLRAVPGAMAFLGVCPPEIEDPLTAPSCHSNYMRIDESAMPLGAALYASVASTWLSELATQR